MAAAGNKGKPPSTDARQSEHPCRACNHKDIWYAVSVPGQRLRRWPGTDTASPAQQQERHQSISLPINNHQLSAHTVPLIWPPFCKCLGRFCDCGISRYILKLHARPRNRSLRYLLIFFIWIFKIRKVKVHNSLSFCFKMDKLYLAFTGIGSRKSLRNCSYPIQMPEREIPVNMRHWPDVGLILGRRRRQQASIRLT